MSLSQKEKIELLKIFNRRCRKHLAAEKEINASSQEQILLEGIENEFNELPQ